MMRPSPIALPELLCLITSHLDDQDVRQCVLVSKEWNRAFSPYLWSTVHALGAHKAHCVLPCAKALTRFGPHVRRVYAPRFLNSAGYLFYQHLIQYCHQLEEIHAFVVSIETWELLLQIVQGPQPPTDQTDEQASKVQEPVAAAAEAADAAEAAEAAEAAVVEQQLYQHSINFSNAPRMPIITLDLEIEQERGFSVCDLLEHTPDLQHLCLNINVGLSHATLDRILVLCPKLASLTLQCESYEYPAAGSWPAALRSPPLALRTLHLRGLNAFDMFRHHLSRVPMLEALRLDLLEPRQEWPDGVMWDMCPSLQNIHFTMATLATSPPSPPELQQIPSGQIFQDDRVVGDLLHTGIPAHRLRTLRLETTGILGITTIVLNQIQQLVSLDIGRITQAWTEFPLSQLLLECTKLERLSVDSIMADASALAVDEQACQTRRFDLRAFVEPVLSTGFPRQWAGKNLRVLKLPISGPCIFHRQVLDQGGTGAVDVAGSVKLERSLLVALGTLRQLEELDLVCHECCTDRHTGKTKKKPVGPPDTCNGYAESGGLEWSLRSGLKSLAGLEQLRSVRIGLAPSPPQGSGRQTHRVEPDVLEWMICVWPHLESFSYVVLHEQHRPGVPDVQLKEEQNRQMDHTVRQWLADRHPGSRVRQHSTASVTKVDLHFVPLKRR